MCCKCKQTEKLQDIKNVSIRYEISQIATPRRGPCKIGEEEVYENWFFKDNFSEECRPSVDETDLWAGDLVLHGKCGPA